MRHKHDALSPCVGGASGYVYQAVRVRDAGECRCEAPQEVVPHAYCARCGLPIEDKETT